MLETFFNSFGFFGAIFIAYMGFAIFIFWVAGVAGIAYLPDSKNKNIKLILCAVFPPYPFFWLFHDIYKERELMREND